MCCCSSKFLSHFFFCRRAWRGFCVVRDRIYFNPLLKTAALDRVFFTIPLPLKTGNAWFRICSYVLPGASRFHTSTRALMAFTLLSKSHPRDRSRTRMAWATLSRYFKSLGREWATRCSVGYRSRLSSFSIFFRPFPIEMDPTTPCGTAVSNPK